MTDQTGTIEHISLGDKIAASIGKSGWTYFDLPNMTLQSFDQLKGIIGDDNLYFITYMNRVYDGVSWHRGQILVSPTGMDNIREWDRVHTL